MKKNLFKDLNSTAVSSQKKLLIKVGDLKEESIHAFNSLIAKLYAIQKAQLLALSLLFLIFFACRKDESNNCYKVTTLSSACQGIAVQFSDQEVTDQNGKIVPNIVELLNVPQEFHKVGTSFYTKFIYDEAAANKPVACPAVYEPYKIYRSTGAYKSSCENQ